MDLKLLEYFVSVADEGNISKAAKQLFISRQALCAAMDKLEGEVGATLLIRSKTGVSLTSNGTYFLDSAKKQQEAWKKRRSSSAPTQRGKPYGRAFACFR